MPAGYSRLASLMGAHPETAIVRRFGSLNALNLLYLQAELTDLENGLHKQAKEDTESGHFERSIYARDWQTLSESVMAEDGNPEQWNLMLRVRDKLSEYSEYHVRPDRPISESPADSLANQTRRCISNT